jgi:hypothetical protein
MRDVTPKQGKLFVEKICKLLLEAGAKEVEPLISSHRDFEIETKVGKLEISIEKEQKTCFTVFARFDDPKRASVYGCNPHSGKYNFFMTLTPQNGEKAAEAAFKTYELTWKK